MFFEGSEKKLEIVVDISVGSLLEWPKERWEQLVAAAEAQILSTVSNKFCHAFLLSESSLFVWGDRLTMITCGQTTLINAIKLLTEWIPINKINCLIFERKNEYHPHLQRTSFYEDANKIKAMFPVECFRFGNPDEHHLYFLNLQKPFEPPSGDTTLELLMYDLDPTVQKVLGKEGVTLAEMHKVVCFEEILPGFQVDDHVFEPCGYSLNAIKDECYFTAHITPQEEGSYVSFETNIPDKSKYPEMIRELARCFQPRTFDVVTFTEGAFQIDHMDDFSLLNSVHQEVSSGYSVDYSHYVKPIRNIGQAHRI